MNFDQVLGRREVLVGVAVAAAASQIGRADAQSSSATLRFGLTPVFLTSDLDLLSELKGYLEQATGRPVQLVSRRTYQEITALLVSRQLDAAWICGYPFVAYRRELSLLAVPVWQGQSRYQSYLIAHADAKADRLEDLRGTVHAFSDPDSNSGYLVTRAALVALGSNPEVFFRQSFFTYGHRNVIRAVSAGLASSGSVDGYVYEVLRETEQALLVSTRIVSKSEWLGFPPIACPALDAASPASKAIRKALVGMNEDSRGRRVLDLLRLDGFREEPAEHYDSIAAKMNLVRRE